MKIYIYKITNNINGKIYVGKHIDKTEIGFDDYMGSGIMITKAQKKYGIDKFKKEILEECSLDELDNKEIYWIQKLNSSNREIGYNIASGGEGGDTLSNNPNLDNIKKKMRASSKHIGRKCSEQTKQKIRKKAIGRKYKPYFISSEERERRRQCAIKNPSFGKRYYTQEEKEKMSKNRTGSVYWNNGVINKRSKACPGEGWIRGILVTPESKQIRSKTHKGKTSSFKGKHHSEEAKKKLSESHKGVLIGSKNPAAKIIEIISPTGERYIVKGTIKEFCKEHNLSYGMYRRYRDKGPCPDSKFSNSYIGKNTVGWIFNLINKE